MKHCLFFAAVCVLFCAWVPTSQAVPPLEPCAWRLEPAQDEVLAPSGAPILLEVAQINDPCSRDGMLTPVVEILDSMDMVRPASVSVGRGVEGIWITPQAQLEPGSYQVSVSYNELMPNDGWGEATHDFELTVLEPQVMVKLSKFEPKTERRFTQECCENGVCEEMCWVSSPSNVLGATITYSAGVRPLDIRVEYASSRSKDDVFREFPNPRTLELFLAGGELGPMVEREMFVSLDDHVEPCVRLFALDPDTKNILHVSSWGCAGPLTVDEPCEAYMLECVDPGGGEDMGSRGPTGAQGPGMVTARPSGGCGGCVTAPGGRGSSSLALWGLLLLGWWRRKNAPLRRADA